MSDITCIFISLKSTGRDTEHTKFIIAEGLDNLRNEEESQVDRLLLHYSMGILQDQWFIVIAPFEKCVGYDGWNRRP